MPLMEMAAGHPGIAFWTFVFGSYFCNTLHILPQPFCLLMHCWFPPPLTLHIPMYTSSAILVQIWIAAHEFFYAPELNTGIPQEGLGL